MLVLLVARAFVLFLCLLSLRLVAIVAAVFIADARVPVDVALSVAFITAIALPFLL